MSFVFNKKSLVNYFDCKHYLFAEVDIELEIDGIFMIAVSALINNCSTENKGNNLFLIKDIEGNLILFPDEYKSIEHFYTILSISDLDLNKIGHELIDDFCRARVSDFFFPKSRTKKELNENLKMLYSEIMKITEGDEEYEI